ncbi:Mrp/NBP35 family ATP-binding protein [Pseudobdellovibrio sp. HCB154]|uniref:Mrp/NBP35 family ATP-binding protein n=1 Tax=Pseudobdellovibrio sp. HCB154 TaxID=3386277 RepID=UPI003916E13A
MNPFDKQTAIPGVKKIIVVASGKGGVGKSTVSTNLALALRKYGNVGLLDADIYGPSIPRMMGAINQKPTVTNGTEINPIERYGLKLMSIGFLAEEGAAIVWRGPMLFKAMDQFFRDVKWGELDYLVIDLPPGTGDVQLSVVQKVPVAAAVIVSTPQNVALIDAKKAIDMFERTQVKIAGLVENMAYMLNPVNGEKMQLFPKGEMESYIAAKGIKKLVEIPFNPNVSLGSEAGIPIMESYSDSAESKCFQELAAKLVETI